MHVVANIVASIPRILMVRMTLSLVLPNRAFALALQSVMEH